MEYENRGINGKLFAIILGIIALVIAVFIFIGRPMMGGSGKVNFKQLQQDWKGQEFEKVETHFKEKVGFENYTSSFFSELQRIQVADDDLGILKDSYRNVTIKVIDSIKTKDYFNVELGSEYLGNKNINIVRAEVTYTDFGKVKKDLIKIYSEENLKESTVGEIQVLYSEIIASMSNYRKVDTVDILVDTTNGKTVIVNNVNPELDKLQELILGNINKLLKPGSNGDLDTIFDLNDTTDLIPGKSIDPNAILNEVERQNLENSQGTGSKPYNPDDYQFEDSNFATDKENWFNEGYEEGLGDDYKEGMYEDPSMYIND